MTYSVVGEFCSHGVKSCIVAYVPGCIRAGINSPPALGLSKALVYVCALK